MSIYNQATLGVSDNLLTFNDYTANPVFRALARSANKFQIRQQDLPVPFESGSSDFLTLLGDVSYVIQGKMYPADEQSYDEGLMMLRSVCSLSLNQADILSDNGYIPYIWGDLLNQKQIFMKPLYVEISETTRQGFVQPFMIVAKIIDPVIYAATLSTASTGQSTALLQQDITNLIPNPSFEADTSNWSSYHTATISQSSTQAYSGTFSGKVITTGGGASAQGISSVIVTGLTAGASYTASVYVFMPNGTTFTLEVDTYNSVGGIVEAINTGFTGTGAWQRVSQTFTLGPTETEAQLFVYATASTTFYVDAAMLQTGTSPTTYFDGSFVNTSANKYAWVGTANASASTDAMINSGNVLYPVQYPVMYGANTFTVSSDCNNIGTLPVYPKTITITGPVINPKITNLATGEYIQINITLTANDQLNITYNNSKQDINLNGVNVSRYLASGSTLFKIYPGTNTIQLSGSSVGSGAVAEVRFYSGWPIS